MRLSTSNFRVPELIGELPQARGSSLAWLAALVLAVALLCGYELFWRGLGFRPSVSDDMDLWAYHRSKVYEGGERALVLVGASSMVQDIDTKILRELAPGRPITQLAVAARAPMATAIDLCRDPRFTGTILLAARASFFAPKFFGQQGRYVAHYHQEWHFYQTPIVMLRAWLGQRLIFMSPDMNVVFYQISLLRWLNRDVVPEPFFRQVFFDRSQQARLTPRRIKQRLAIQRRKRKTQPASLADDQAYVRDWKKRVDAVAEAAGELRARGGRLTPILLPMSGDYRSHLEMRFPRAVFWDYIAAKLGPPVVNYADYPSLQEFPPPDGFHMSADQTKGFTRALAGVLRRQGVLGRVQ